MKVAILGAGPAGLFAAHAAVGHGHDVTILSKPRKSFMRGAQYLHRPIPGLSGDSFKITYELEGTVEGYRQKVYGDDHDLQVSPETLVGVHDAWDIREAYDRAWSEYHGLIKPWDASSEVLRNNDVLRGMELVVSTIPAEALCTNMRHTFDSQDVYVTDFIRYKGAFTAEEDGAAIDNLVVCSGEPDDWWYRASRIHGWENTEYPLDHRPNAPGHVWKVRKPIMTDCTCSPVPIQRLMRVGRYGAWKKGVLSDAAFYDVEARLS